MNVSSIVSRLRSKAVALRAVGGAVDLATAQARGFTTCPAAFVLAAKDRPDPNAFASGFVQQTVPTDFAVLLAVKCLVDTTGEKALDVLEPVRESVRQALLGWVPDDADVHCEFAGGEVVGFADGVLLWNDVFSTQYTIRSNA